MRKLQSALAAMEYKKKKVMQTQWLISLYQM